MKNNEIKALAKKYAEVFGDRSPREINEKIEMYEILGYDWEEVEINPYGWIEKDFCLKKGRSGQRIYIPGVKCNELENKYYLVWAGGKERTFGGVGNSIEESEIMLKFHDTLMSYNALGYGTCGESIYFSIEDGKRLIADYEKICRKTKEELVAVAKKVELQRAKENYEYLLSESGYKINSDVENNKVNITCGNVNVCFSCK